MTTPVGTRGARRRLDLSALKEHAPVLAVYAAVVVLAVIAAAKSPSFRSPANLINLLRQQVVLGILSTGQTFTLLTGGLDLSVGSVVKLATLLVAGVMDGRPAMLVPVILLAIGLGAAVGAVNGVLVTRLRVNPFIATFGVYSIVRGLAYAYSTEPVGQATRSLRRLYNGQWGPVPVVVVLFVVFLVGAGFVLRRTAFGRWVYAVGGNEQVARLSGINVDRIKASVYVVSGACAGIAALVLVSRMGVGDPIVGEGMELDSITAVVLGGTSFMGGRGSLAGTIGGVLLLGLINNMLTMMAVSSFYQGLIKGLIILLAVGLYKQRRS